MTENCGIDLPTPMQQLSQIEAEDAEGREKLPKVACASSYFSDNRDLPPSTHIAMGATTPLDACLDMLQNSILWQYKQWKHRRGLVGSRGAKRC
eukprot:356114-Chlamydomonas_euryale.AAC.5